MLDTSCVFSLLADLTLVVHLLFVVFVVAGGMLVLRRSTWAWVHGPAAAWGIAVEWTGWVCPLTPLENWLRGKAGAAGYDGGFLETYLLPVLYPGEMTRDLQLVLGLLVLVINVVFYSMAWTRYRRRERS